MLCCWVSMWSECCSRRNDRNRATANNVTAINREMHLILWRMMWDLVQYYFICVGSCSRVCWGTICCYWHDAASKLSIVWADQPLPLADRVVSILIMTLFVIYPGETRAPIDSNGIEVRSTLVVGGIVAWAWSVKKKKVAVVQVQCNSCVAL